MDDQRQENQLEPIYNISAYLYRIIGACVYANICVSERLLVSLSAYVYKCVYKCLCEYVYVLREGSYSLLYGIRYLHTYTE